MIVFDTETTGLLRPQSSELHLQPFIIEICMVKVDEKYKVIDELLTFIKPPVPVPDEIVEITHITNEMLADAPAFPLVYDDILNFCIGERDICAHNCSFDMDMLLHEIKRMGLEFHFPWPPNQICTVEASFPIQNKRLKLSQLYEIATGNSSFPNAHRAKADVLALVECVKFLRENEFI